MIHISIHRLLFIQFRFGVEPIPVDPVQEVGYTLDRLPVYGAANTVTKNIHAGMSQCTLIHGLKSPINLKCRYLTNSTQKGPNWNQTQDLLAVLTTTLLCCPTKLVLIVI